MLDKIVKSRPVQHARNLDLIYVLEQLAEATEERLQLPVGRSRHGKAE
jgi:hypothetical protein